MLTYYDQHGIEALIRPQHLDAIFKALPSVGRDYVHLIDHSISPFQSASSLNTNRVQDARRWLEEEGATGDFVLDTFVSSPPKAHAIILALNGIQSLGTRWGKRHAEKQGAYLVTYEFGEGSGVQEVVAAFHERLVKSTSRALGHKRPPRVTSISNTNPIFEKLRKKKHTTPEITASTSRLIKAIKETDVRNVLLRTRQAKDPTLKNISESAGIDAADVKRILTRNERIGIVSRQLDVVCKGCGQLMARVPDREALANLVDRGMFCVKCKARVSKSCYEPCFVVDSSAGKLLDASKWMGLLVREALQECGVSSKVRTEVVDGPNELDLVANIDGDLLLMELKDNRFSIGHAYSFVGKCSQYKPDISLIVASHGVDPDVKEYVANTGVVAHYIEDLSALDVDLQSVLSEHYAKRFTRLVSSIPWDFLFSRSVLAQFGHTKQLRSSPYGYLSGSFHGPIR